MRSCWLGVVLALLAGCGSGVGSTSTPFPEVNDRLRQSCANWLQTDAQIAVVVAAYESDRQSGFTEQQAWADTLAVAEQTYSEDREKSAYVTCMGAIIDQVWP